MSARLPCGAHPRAHLFTQRPHPSAPRRHTTTNPRSTSRRTFRTSPISRLDDHYATLGIAPSAPASEVKKQFYTLSKAYHPDHNPTNPDAAAKKFVAISAAYSVLGDPTKREKYDRDFNHARGPAQSSGAPTGSYSSASAYAPGARKASGLSKRRAHFRGPPPSFYRSGGWGSASAKREANIGRDAREFEARRQKQDADATKAGNTAAPGSWPFISDYNDVVHFDRDGHYRTQSSVEDQLQRGRRKRRGVVEQAAPELHEGQSSANFAWVCGILAVGLAVPTIFFARQ